MPSKRPTPPTSKAPEQPSLLPQKPMNQETKDDSQTKKNGRLTKTEIDGLLRILRANVKTARAGILARAADLKAAFEIQLNTTYPPSGDPVWLAEYEAAIKACEPHIERIEQRSIELGIGTRFRPSLHLPMWEYGGEQLFKDL